MKFKGTRGNLKVEEIKEDFFVNIIDEKGQSVAGITTNEDFYEEAVCYGRLFSKAPEMLEAIQKALFLQEMYIKSGGSANFTNVDELNKLIKEATEL